MDTGEIMAAPRWRWPIFERDSLRTVLLLAAMVTFAFVAPAHGQEKIRVLAIGQVFPAECPLPHWFPTDPLFELTLIPTDVDMIAGFTEDEARRYVRQYFPRTKEGVGEYEFIMYPDGNLQPLTNVQISYLTDAVLTGGRSGLATMGGGLNSPEGNVWYTWLGTTLAELLPVNMDPTMKRPNSDFSIRVTKDDPPVLSVFKPLGIERVVGYHFTTLFEKLGSTVWAIVKPVSFYKTDTPWLVSMDQGKGNFWAVADDIDHGWWWYMHHAYNNPYSFDILVNIILYARGRDLPENIEIVHKAREEFRNFKDRRIALFSILEFVEKFGGHMGKIDKMLEKLDGIRDQAEDEYLAQNFEAAFDLLKKAEDMNTEARVEAMKLRDQALFYVYLTEWLAVTGTLLVSGSVLYALMIRRAMFREVVLTRGR